MTPDEVLRRCEEIVRQSATVLDRLADWLAREAERNGKAQRENTKRGH